MVRPRLSLFQGTENSLASKSPTRLGFFLHLLFPGAKQARQPSPSEDLKPPPLTLFSLLFSIILSWDSSLPEPSCFLSLRNVCSKGIGNAGHSPQYDHQTLFSLFRGTSIPKLNSRAEEAPSLGKGFQDFLDGQVEKECRGQRGLMGTISLFSLQVRTNLRKGCLKTKESPLKCSLDLDTKHLARKNLRSGVRGWRRDCNSCEEASSALQGKAVSCLLG